jgi:DNA-directed RNA polymerase specialized sigma24 family protein
MTAEFQRHDHGPRHFATTQWSVVLAAGDGDDAARAAMAELCSAYWYPLYAYVRRRTADAHEAADLTQAFFCRLLENRLPAKADRSRGRFRSFLLAALQNFLVNEWHKGAAAKRGGGKLASFDLDAADSRYRLEPAHDLTPEKLYERRWVVTLIDRVLDELRRELADSGKGDHFDRLKMAVVGAADADQYDQAAVALGISPAAAKQEAYRLRKRYRELFRAEVARTVERNDDIDDEIARLLEILRDDGEILRYRAAQ